MFKPIGPRLFSTPISMSVKLSHLQASCPQNLMLKNQFFFTKKCPWIRGGKSHLTHPRDRNRIFLFVWLCLNIGSLQIHWLIITFLIKTAIIGGLCTPPCSDSPKYRSWLIDVCPGYAHDIPISVGCLTHPIHLVGTLVRSASV